MKFLTEDIVAFNVHASSPEHAIELAGELLLQANCIDKSYIDAMIDVYHQFGAYFVLAPSIAMPHARPEEGAIKTFVGLVTLREPIFFGHQKNDPVSLVFTLGSPTTENLLQMLQKLSITLGNKENISALKKANEYKDIKKIIEEETP